MISLRSNDTQFFDPVIIKNIKKVKSVRALKKPYGSKSTTVFCTRLGKGRGGWVLVKNETCACSSSLAVLKLRNKSHSSK